MAGLYLIATPFTRPVSGVNTSIENWRNQPASTEVLETVEIHDSMPSWRAQHISSVIIDLDKMMVIKCRHAGSSASIMSKYLDRYSSEILEAMRLRTK